MFTFHRKRTWAQLYRNTEPKHPASVLIILGDFNKANLSRELPKYRQHVTCPTRDYYKILDHCYTTIKNAYHSVPRAALGLSDHCLVHLIPTYRQKLKSAKPVVKIVKRWTNETERVLQACLDLTDWSVFEAAANDLEELTETVTSYISFCEDSFNLQQCTLQHTASLNCYRLVDATELWAPEQPDTGTVSSPKQSISWTLDNNYGTHTIYTLIHLFI